MSDKIYVNYWEKQTYLKMQYINSKIDCGLFWWGWQLCKEGTN